jgi:hypothetical protein
MALLFNAPVTLVNGETELNVIEWKTEELGENYIPVQLFPPQIQYDLILVLSEVRGGH